MAHVAAWLYWTLVVALVGIGALGIFSIGLPLLVLGFVLGALYPLRQRAEAFWPPVLAAGAFFAGWWLLGPVGCEVEAERGKVPIRRPAARQVSSAENLDGALTTCRSALGISYGGGSYWIGPLAGVAAAAAVGGSTYLVLRRLGSRGG